MGSGTGIVGLVAAKAGAKQVVMTDYEPDLLQLVKANIELQNNDQCEILYS